MTERVLALVGPTAAGKSEIALEVASRLGAEIVAVDAFTVYRGMDVGTAKPSAAARQRVPHHGMDLLEPEEDCTVEWFQGEARRAIADIRARGRLPLLVGGSGLYFRAIVDDLTFPPTDPAVRADLESRHAGDPAAAHAELARVDPVAAARIDPENVRRTVRALEVIELTGRPFSSWRVAWDAYRSIYPLAVVGVEIDRAVLAERIRERVDTMLEAGLLDECRALARRPLSRAARQAIGYAEGLAWVRGALSLQEMRERTRARTRRYAARQQRWFAGDPRVAWARADQAVAVLRRAAEEAPKG